MLLHHAVHVAAAELLGVVLFTIAAIAETPQGLIVHAIISEGWLFVDVWLVVGAILEQLAFVFEVVARALRPTTLGGKEGGAWRTKAWRIVADIFERRIVLKRVVVFEICVAVDLIHEVKQRLDGRSDSPAYAGPVFDGSGEPAESCV